MTQGDGAAVSIQSFRLQFQGVGDCQHLGCLGFVDFEAINLFQAQTAALQQQLNGRHRADAHGLRRYAHGGGHQQPRQWRARTGRETTDQRRRGTIHHRTAVAGGLHTASVNRRQPRQGGAVG
ncbi:hypothetical protein D3C79_868750 [compost metagenome]